MVRGEKTRGERFVRLSFAGAAATIEKAIERYIVYPGQATAYMIGKLKIMELREMARDELGDAFDIRGFHDVILISGPVPLSIMEENVHGWVKGQKGG
jgi:uncharacterized protein (DUF885 family)